MTRRTQLRILAQHLLRVETGAVRVEAPAAYHGVTGKTVAFDVTRHASLERLSRGLTVSQRELPVTSVVPGAAEQGATGNQVRLLMAALAELAVVVAIAARRGPGVRFGGVPRKECRGMVAPAGARFGFVNGEAF